MDFSEFLRHLGADPHNRDPEFLRARDSNPEFQQATEAAEAFETRLERAVAIPAPEGLLDDLLEISQGDAVSVPRAPRWRSVALAAGILIAVGAAGITWNMNRGWDSVDEYLVAHYRHDGDSLLEKAGADAVGDVEAIFSKFDVAATPAFAQVISVIKYCPTPDGKGVHMVLNTEEGLVTLIYMPETAVIDQQTLEFDNMKAMLVGLQKGSAIIIGNNTQGISNFYSLVQESIIPTVNKA